MIIANKKRAVSMILSKMKSDGSTSETEVAPETGDHNQYTSLAEDMLQAFKSGSVQELAACLKVIMNDDQSQDA